MKRVFINPIISGADRADGGIRRVVEAQCMHLEKFDWRVVQDPDSADLIVNHGTLCEERPGVPMISSCHGLYWRGYDWAEICYDANRRVIDAMVRADHVTAPSQWVRTAIARGTLINPTVIHHGIHPENWGAGESYGYVLWNKARTDPVSDPGPINRLAEMLRNVPFLTTFGRPSENTKVIGAVPYERMMPIVEHAGVYLGTVRETFGISTLEALLKGVPVVGWDFGGQQEIIQTGYNGILVPEGNYDALAEAVLHVLNNRRRFSDAALETTHQVKWHWVTQIGKYARLFDWIVGLRAQEDEHPKVSVVITCRNLANFLGAAIQSVIDQTMKDWEVVIIDDASTDHTPEEILRWRKVDHPPHIRIRSHRCPENVGLSEARNIGWKLSEGKYIIFLDADDMLDRSALEVLTDALDKDSSIHIASGGLDLMDEFGSNRKKNDWPPGSFDWWGQMAHLNQLPYSCLMRRRVLENSGGYRVRQWRAEDAEFWTRVTSLGFRAKRVTSRATLVYRQRSGSKGGVERTEHKDKDGDWTYWFPWRAGASSGEEGYQMMTSGTGFQDKINSSLVPFGAQGAPPRKMKAWPVRHHADPAVSVIIPVGIGHRPFLVDALDSVLAQTCPSWEVIVVDDSASGPFSSIEPAALGHPHARVVVSDPSLYWTGEKTPVGAGKARNVGVKYARAPFLLFLDADDMLMPQAIEKMLAKYVEADGGYIYGDCLGIANFSRLGSADDGRESITSLDYDQLTFLSSGYSDGMPGRHSVTMLIATVDFKETLGGFDTDMKYWEDWELALKAAALGLKGSRVPEPILLYRYSTGTRRRSGFEMQKHLQEELREKYEPYVLGDKPMCGCTGGAGGASAKEAALKALEGIEDIIVNIDGIDPLTIRLAEVKSVRLRYVGTRFGAVPYRGPVTRQTYSFGLEPGYEYHDVAPADVPHFLSMLDQFIVVEVFK